MSADSRRDDRRPRVSADFAPGLVEAALDLLALTDLAWHDCYGESAPPSGVADDIFVVARGDLARLARAARLAVIDFRDLRLQADARRAGD